MMKITVMALKVTNRINDYYSFLKKVIKVIFFLLFVNFLAEPNFLLNFKHFKAKRNEKIHYKFVEKIFFNTRKNNM